MHELVCCTDGAIADLDCGTNLLWRLGVAHEMRDEVETGASNREWRATSSDALLGDDGGAVLGNKLHTCWQTKLGTSTRHEDFGTGSVVPKIIVRVYDSPVSSKHRAALQLLLALQKGLEGLECTANLLLGHVCHLEDFTEAALLLHGAACNEDAAGNDGVLRLALEQLGIVGLAVEMLCSLGRGPADVLRVAQRGDLAKGGLERLVGLVMVGLVVGSRQVAHTQAAVAKANLRLQLGAVEQRVGGVTDTRGVIVALVVIREGAPLGARVDDPVGEDTPTGAADGVARAELLDEVGGHFAAVGAHQGNIQVVVPLVVLDGRGRVLVDLAGRELTAVWRVRHGGKTWTGDSSYRAHAASTFRDCAGDDAGGQAVVEERGPGRRRRCLMSSGRQARGRARPLADAAPSCGFSSRPTFTPKLH